MYGNPDNYDSKMRPRFYHPVDLFTSNTYLLLICLSYYDYRMEVVTLLHYLNKEKRALLENYELITKKIVFKKLFKVFMSNSFNEREECREMTEVCLIQKDATLGKPLKIFIDRFYDLTTVHYFKKYNPKSRIEELLITFSAMKEYKEQLSKIDGVSYPEMEYPDMFGPLSLKHIQI